MRFLEICVVFQFFVHKYVAGVRMGVKLCSVFLFSGGGKVTVYVASCPA
jgi:uncharacterized membrane protein YoaT (DUF817 family)